MGFSIGETPAALAALGDVRTPRPDGRTVLLVRTKKAAAREVSNAEHERDGRSEKEAVAYQAV
jgi:hypothetical protein